MNELKNNSDCDYMYNVRIDYYQEDGSGYLTAYMYEIATYEDRISSGYDVSIEELLLGKWLKSKNEAIDELIKQLELMKD